MQPYKGEDPVQKPTSSREGGEHQKSARALPAFLRRVPRVAWLGMSAITLIAGSLAWHYQSSWSTVHREDSLTSPTFLSLDWWTRPKVQNTAASLPEISGRIYGISIERRAGGNRIWIAGAHGLLAYSDDEGNCWVPFEYQADRGEFRESTNVGCAGKEKRAQVSWPKLVSTVYAAERKQSSAGETKPLPQQQAPVQQQQATSVQQQQHLNPPSSQQDRQQTSASVPFTEKEQVFPRNVDFGEVYLDNESPVAVTKRGTITIRNVIGPDPAKVFLSGFVGEGSNEFEVAGQTCDPTPQGPSLHMITVEKECEIRVLFSPKTAGEKAVSLTLQSRDWPSPITVRFMANVHDLRKPGGQNDTKRVDSKPVDTKTNGNADTSKAIPLKGELPAKTKDYTGVKAPGVAPDLLSIDGSPDLSIVSTGGWVWTLNKENTWIGEPQQAGTRRFLGSTQWEFEDPANAKWASETRVTSLASLNLPTARYNCADCTMRVEASAEARSVWAVGWSTDTAGEHGVILGSRDGGSSWEAMTRGALPTQERLSLANGRTWVWPPNWYWAVLILSALLATPALLPPPDFTPSEVTTSSVEGRLSSDKPLDPGDLDVLGLTGLALGLSRFLRNKKTLPPLTIAVNGEWGSGKSSLMNLLRCDLKSYGMRPVWFNAWHHQKEEYLLAALLQTVRLEAVPPIWNLLGIPFRLRLLRYRFRRRWPALVLLACVLIFLIALDYHLRIPGEHRSNLFLWLVSQFTSADKTAEGLSTLPFHGGGLAALATIAALWKGMTAFGANPAVLLASVAKGNKIKDFDAQTSFRQRFAVEFRDFTQALGPKRPLVVFIDDLDRCLPENVRDVLEAVNFLVSSGDCFVVLGVDRAQVQRAIGLSFKDVAEEAGGKDVSAAAGNATLSPSDLAREKRAEFAQKYLEKLINLEVRVPLAADDGTKQQLFKRPLETHHEARIDVAIRFVLEVSKWAVPAALALLLLIGTARLGKMAVPSVQSWIEGTVPTEPISTKKVEGNAVNVSGGTVTQAPAAGSSLSPKAANASGASRDLGKGEVVAPVPGATPKITAKGIWPARWILSIPLYLAAIFVLLVANVALTTRPGVVTHDSKEFTDAMEQVWYPLVLAKQNTPRAAKRFINRVRYLAMRQQGYQEHASAWERVLFPDRLREPAKAQGWQPIPEPLLVALAAIEQIQPQWVYNDTAFDWVKGSNGLSDLKSSFPASIPEAATLLENARKLHQQKFSQQQYPGKHVDWDSLPTYRSTFLSIWPQLSPESV